jgi:alpha-glucosidase
VWPFTRLLAGHADFTPTVFGTKRRETSWAHQIASAAILTSPLLVYGGNPKSLLESPASDVIKGIPASWDQTIVLPPSEIGDLALYARRHGRDWFVAAMNNELVKDLKVDTAFLDRGKTYRLTLVKDLIGVTAPADKVEIETRDFVGGETLAVSVRGGGGFVARLVAQ